MQAPFAQFVREFSEVYEVVRTVMVVRNRTLYKVEVLKDHTSAAKYKVHFSVQERVLIQSLNSKSEQEFKKVWVDLTLPWVETEDAEAALKEALLQLSQIEA